MSSPSEQNHLAHLKYRPDIDGLRAIAVLAVVLYHASPKWLRGGFVGVDIFFVISGYLISTIIFGSLGGRGFSYAEFYARRIRRIFPSLVLVLAATLGFGWYVLLSDEFRQLGRHVLGSAGFVQNLVLLREAGYFDTAAESKPLLHLWSLAVEEQFYIFWPMVLGLAWARSGRSVLTWMAVAVGLSFALNIGLVYRYPDAAFYLPFTRVWELAAGAILAYMGLRRQPHHSGRSREWQSVAGLVLIVLGLLVIHRGKAFPGFWAVLPVLGACLCIAAGPGAWFNRHVLGSRLFVWFGLISYPLYLWHWPLLAYARVLQSEGDPSRAIRFGAVAASVLLAWLSYRFVERPLRRREGAPVVAGLSIAMAVLALIGAAAATRLLLPRNDAPGLQVIASAGSDWAYPDGMQPVQVNGQTLYRIGDGPGKVLLVGDSHVEQYGPRAVELAKERPDDVRPLVFATRGACPPISNVLEDRDPICGERFDAVRRYALSPEVSSVVVGGCWTCYFDIGDAPAQPQASAPPPPDRYYYLDRRTGTRHYLRGGDGVERAFEALAAELRAFKAAGKTTYLLLNIPVGADFEPRSRLTGDRLGVMHAVPVTPLVAMTPSQAALHERLRRLAVDNGAIPIDPEPTLCQSDRQCRRADAKGEPIYKDGVHLRARFVRSAASYLDPALLKPR
ncbi:MAG TPA: acyltransferase family protein [Burkholderiaceae bacterium]|nr:acyltransferase family protein [Burkholderiaceae bacterium]